MANDNLAAQADEMEAITSIFPEIVRYRDENSVDFEISVENSCSLNILLRCSLPPDYPCSSKRRITLRKT